MAGTGTSLEVSGDGDRSALHAAIWSRIETSLDMHLSGDAYRDVWKYASESIGSCTGAGLWGAVGDRLQFAFSDFAGTCSRSANVWAHWVELVIASEWPTIVRLAEHHGLAIESERPVLARLLAEGRPGYVVIHDELWAADEARLQGDDQALPLDALTADELALHAVARTQCLCGPCKILRPTPAIEKGLRTGLDDASSASSAAWYIERWSRSSSETLLALINAQGSDMLRPAIEAHAPRIATAWDDITRLLPDLRGVPRGRALYALASLKLDDARRAVLVQAVRESLSDDKSAEAAVEVAGMVGRDDIAIAEELAALLDRNISAELRHQTVLGLVNLHMPPRKPTASVRACLEREAGVKSEAGKLATWYLKSF